jgi:hypothetical protein
VLRRAPVPSFHQVPRDIDSPHICTEFRRGQRCRAIATAQIQYFESFRDSECLDERLSALAHGVGDAREIAFFPECFVWISRSIHNVGLLIGLCGQNYSEP